MIRMALDGLYHPKNYSDLEIDLATVVYTLGSAATLHALHKSPFLFPSRVTLLDQGDNSQHRITVGEIKMSDILANIELMFKDMTCVACLLEERAPSPFGNHVPSANISPTSYLYVIMSTHMSDIFC